MIELSSCPWRILLFSPAQTILHRWHSQTSVLKRLPSLTIWFSTKLFMKEMSQLSNKTVVLDPNSLLCSSLYDLSRVFQAWFGFPTNRFSSSLPEWIPFENRGSTVFCIFFLCNKVLFGDLLWIFVTGIPYFNHCSFTMFTCGRLTTSPALAIPVYVIQKHHLATFQNKCQW